jgi:hypothetical protein
MTERIAVMLIRAHMSQNGDPALTKRRVGRISNGERRGDTGMTTFQDRENAFENKFAHDQEVQFRVFARRNHLLGMWAGEKLNKSGDDLAEYAMAVVASDLAERGDDDVLRKVSGDFKSGQIAISDAEIRTKMDQLLVEAKQQIAKGV